MSSTPSDDNKSNQPEPSSLNVVYSPSYSSSSDSDIESELEDLPELMTPIPEEQEEQEDNSKYEFAAPQHRDFSSDEFRNNESDVKEADGWFATRQSTPQSSEEEEQQDEKDGVYVFVDGTAMSSGMDRESFFDRCDKLRMAFNDGVVCAESGDVNRFTDFAAKANRELLDLVRDLLQWVDQCRPASEMSGVINRIRAKLENRLSVKARRWKTDFLNGVNMIEVQGAQVFPPEENSA